MSRVDHAAELREAVRLNSALHLEAAKAAVHPLEFRVRLVPMTVVNGVSREIAGRSIELDVSQVDDALALLDALPAWVRDWWLVRIGREAF